MKRTAALILPGVVVLLLLVMLWFHKLFLIPEPPEPFTQGDFSLTNVTLINPMQDRRPGANIGIRDGRLAIEPGLIVNSFDQYNDMYVLPGFIDMHTHLVANNRLNLTQHYGLLNLAYGVTTIRDAGDLDGTAVPAARELIASGRPFPKLISCGAFVTKGAAVWPNTIAIDSPDQAESVVSELAAQGHGCVKAYEGLTPEIISALTVAAGKRNMQLIGHVPHALTVEQSGLLEPQHYFGVPVPGEKPSRSVLDRNSDWRAVDFIRLSEVTSHMLERGVRNTPTINTLAAFVGYRDYPKAAAMITQVMPSLFADVVWNPQTGLPVYRNMDESRFTITEDALQKKLTLTKMLSDGGATLYIGTDVGQPFTAPGYSYWEELRLFAAAGIHPEQVLAYATNVAGQTLGNGAGRIVAGGPADLLIFKQDPTQSLDALDTLQAVVVGGRLFHKTELDQAVDESLEHFNSGVLPFLAHRAAQSTIDKSTLRFE